MQVLLVGDVVVERHRSCPESLCDFAHGHRPLAPSIERQLSLTELPDAIQHLGTGRTRGKQVIEIP